VSISLTFYARIFCQYFGAKNYKANKFGFEIFCQKDIGKKCACKILIKLTPGNGAIDYHWKSKEQSQNGKHSPASSESGSEKVRRFCPYFSPYMV